MESIQSPIMTVSLFYWIGFNAFILTLLIFELCRFSRRPHVIGMKEACFKSAGWIALALVFNGLIYIVWGRQAALDFFAGYLIEKSLSIDNLFVFFLLFDHFKVPQEAKFRVLFFGVLGAILMRCLLIFGGIELISHFEGAFILFGLFLIYAAWRLLRPSHDGPVKTISLLGYLKRWFPFTTGYRGCAFFVKEAGRWAATPLFALLVAVELTDLFFAFDSVPAILGITTEPFIVYTSNIFALLGLRALFFALSYLMIRLVYLQAALAFILAFVGCKMILRDVWPISTEASLLVIVTALVVACVVSFKSLKQSG